MADMTDSVAAQSIRVRHVIVAPDSVIRRDELRFLRRLEVIPDPGAGLTAAVNAGMAALGGEEFVLWLNDDDTLLPHALQRLIALLDASPEAVLAIGGTVLTDADGEHMMSFTRTWLTRRLLRWGPGTLFMPSCLFRARALQQVLPFDESLRHAADVELIIRLQRLGPTVTCPEPTATFRWHDDSLTVRDRRASITEVEAVRWNNHRGLARLVYGAWRPVAASITRTGKWRATRLAVRRTS